MPKILYLITQSELGGAQRYVFDLANNLKGEFNIAVTCGEQKQTGELAEILKNNNINFYTISHLKRAISPLNDFLALTEIIKLIKKIKPDIIHLNSSKISILGSLATLCIPRYALRVVYTVHGWVFNEPLSGWLKSFYLWAEKFTARFKDVIICVSEYDRQIALAKKIAPAEKLITIHNGLEPIIFLPRQQARKELNLGDADFVIGTIGNFYKTKGFEYLIKAAKIINQSQQAKYKFIVIGEGGERKNLEALIKQNNLTDNFILAGRIDEAAKLLPAFDVYVSSSVKEGLSYTIIEAMQAGLPIVATNVGGNPELIEDNQTGLLAEAGKPENLAQKITTLINNKKISGELGRRAEIKARQEFNLAEMVEKTKKVYLS